MAGLEDERLPDDRGRADCFVCGHVIEDVYAGDHLCLWFGLESELTPQLPCHPFCLEGRNASQLTALYHKAMMDMVYCPAPPWWHRRYFARGPAIAPA